MTQGQRTNDLSGKTVRWTWTEGPTKGTTNEHVFNEDGTVTWSVIEGPSKGRSSTEKEYAVWKITDDVLAVSYLAQSGYTLTVILNFRDNTMVGFASEPGNGIRSKARSNSSAARANDASKAINREASVQSTDFSRAVQCETEGSNNKSTARLKSVL